MICVALCREARQESNSDRIAQVKRLMQKRFNEARVLVRFQMPGKREIPIVKCSGGELLSQRDQCVRSTFDWVVCSEPLAGLRRTRVYGHSIVSWRSMLGGNL